LLSQYLSKYMFSEVQ